MPPKLISTERAQKAEESFALAKEYANRLGPELELADMFHYQAAAVSEYIKALDGGCHKALLPLYWVSIGANCALFYRKRDASTEKQLLAWLENAAYLGNPNAMCELGRVYMEGELGVRQSYYLADSWFDTAKRKGNRETSIYSWRCRIEGIEAGVFPEFCLYPKRTDDEKAAALIEKEEKQKYHRARQLELEQQEQRMREQQEQKIREQQALEQQKQRMREQQAQELALKAQQKQESTALLTNRLLQLARDAKTMRAEQVLQEYQA